MTKLMKFAASVMALALFATVSVSTPAQASDVKKWQVKVVKLVAKKQVYPRSALKKELEGSAKVKISIDRSGAIQNFDVTQSTGHDVLDKEVGKLIKRIDPLPSPPDALPDSNLTFVLPLTWALQ